MAFSWLINGGDPNYLLSGMILQVGKYSSPIRRICGKLSNLEPPAVQISARLRGTTFMGQTF